MYYLESFLIDLILIILPILIGLGVWLFWREGRASFALRALFSVLTVIWVIFGALPSKLLYSDNGMLSGPPACKHWEWVIVSGVYGYSYLFTMIIVPIALLYFGFKKPFSYLKLICFMVLLILDMIFLRLSANDLKYIFYGVQTCPEYLQDSR